MWLAPVLCEQGNPNECYQPSPATRLAIGLTQAPAVQQYTVTAVAGNGGAVSPSGSQIVNSGTSLTFTAIPTTNYGVNQWLVDGTLVQTGGTTYQLNTITTSHTVTVTFGMVTLTPSVSTLGLSVSCPAGSGCAQTNAQLTGTSRQITITNNGSINATHVVVSQAGLPSDTSVSLFSCDTIVAHGGQCVIKVTPGATASSDATSSASCSTGVEPQGSVSVTADGGLLTSVNIYVLSYGCIYQGGFIYSVDDTTDYTGSIGGKVLALTDQKPAYSDGIVWDTDSTCATGSCTQQTNAWDFYDGPGNTYRIVSILNGQNGNTNTPKANYSAAVCSTYNDGIYVDWYLPAICEIGPDNGGPGCAIGTPNIVNNLGLLVGDANATNPATSCSYGRNCLAGYYWSSTESEFSGNRLSSAWGQVLGRNPYQANDAKFTKHEVRCSRALTL
jgi:hypothetical protein